MRHQKRLKKLGRSADHRKALLKNLCASLVLNERIKTTKPKAKVLKGYVDRVITLAKKKDVVNAYRMLTCLVFQKKAIEKIIKELKERYKERTSGFTRIIQIKTRSGDNAM